MNLSFSRNRLGLAITGAAILLLLAGCGDEPDRAELDLLLQEDPMFHELVRTKVNLETQISGIHKELAAQKTSLDEKIQKLRSDYDASRQAKEKTIGEYEALVRKQRADFAASYDKSREQLQARKRMRADIEKAIREGQSVLDKKEKLAISPKETAEWEERVTNLQVRISPLDAEISALEAQVSLKHKKLKYL
jgi:chromosome segregation ATPase